MEKISLNIPREQNVSDAFESVGSFNLSKSLLHKDNHSGIEKFLKNLDVQVQEGVH